MILRSHISHLDRIPELSDELLDLLFQEVDSEVWDAVDSLVAIGIVPHTPEIHSIKSSLTLNLLIKLFHFCCCDTRHSSAVAARLVSLSGADGATASEWRQFWNVIRRLHTGLSKTSYESNSIIPQFTAFKLSLLCRNSIPRELSIMG